MQRNREDNFSGLFLIFKRMNEIERGFADNRDDRRISDVPAFFRELRSAVSVETVRPLECPESRHDGTDVGHFLNDISPFGTGVVFYTWMV